MNGLTISRKCGVAVKAATSFVLLALVFTNGLGFFTSSAHAGFIGDLVTVTFTDDQGNSASHSLANPFANLPPQAQVPQRVRDMLSTRFAMVATNGQMMGYIDELTVDLDGDPIAEIGFSVTTVGADTNIRIVSATVVFDALASPEANASAEIHVVDNGNNGAMATVIAPNIGLFRAIYNGDTTYTELFGDVSVTAGGTGMIDANVSHSIVGAVTSIQAVLNFRLSAGDTASGFGRIEVVPEPTTGILAFLGSLALAGIRRRRNR